MFVNIFLFISNKKRRASIAGREDIDIELSSLSKLQSAIT